MKHLLLIVLFFVVTSAQAQPTPTLTTANATTSSKKKVAVYITGDLEAGLNEVFASKLTTLITQSEQYIAMERTFDFLNEINKEQDLQCNMNKTYIGDEKIAEIGQRLAVDYVAVIKISKVFDELYVIARMLDVVTKEVHNAVETPIGAINNMEDLQRVANQISVFILFDFNRVKITPAISDGQKLYNTKVPDGYHIATEKELAFLFQVFQTRGKRIYLPAIIGIEIAKTRNSHRIDNYSTNCFYSTIRGTFKQICDKKFSSRTIEFWYQELEHSCSNCFRINMTKPTCQPFEPSYLYFVKD